MLAISPFSAGLWRGAYRFAVPLPPAWHQFIGRSLRQVVAEFIGNFL
jgi:hypothetical protein